ncbi:MAG: hypothetical protein KBC33_00570 [Candidatus Pacebacteria bacterium]|nr:hypothetical protein [Candidatus Paceibacterota bacterium]
MKKLTVFETSIIGLLVGVVVAAYLAFLVGTDGFVGNVISWIALVPVTSMVVVPQSVSLVVSFVLSVVVFTIYGALVGVVLRKHAQAGIVTAALALLIVVGGAFEQVKGSASHVPMVVEPIYTAAVFDARPKQAPAPQQYFGKEVLGDLNGDGIEDVAFLITRDDEDRGTLHYLVSALTFDGGRAGTNLIFVGEKLNPLRLSIENGQIGLEYEDFADQNVVATSTMYAHVVNGILEKTEKVEIE